MKIREVRVYLVHTARLHPVVVEIETDDGLVGIGEAGIAYGLGQSAVAGMIRDIAERILIGKDPLQITALWSEMYDHTFWAKGNGGPMVYGAISALELALWDIKARALGVPVYALFGGKVRDSVQLYANGWGQPHEEVKAFADAAEQAVAEGFTALKCYPFAYRESDTRATSRHPSMRSLDKSILKKSLDKLRAARSAVGPDVELMLDLSGGLSCDETIRFCRAVEDLDIFFIEEPCDPFDIGALKKISDHVRIPVAAGERVYTRFGFRPMLEAHAVDVIQPDITLAGGFAETLKISAMAEAYDIRVQPHVCGSPLSTAIALHMDACITNFAIQEIYPYWQAMPGYVEILDDPPEARIKGGKLDIQTGPGWGVNLRASAIEPFLYCRVGA